jgi:hypothetical protein
VEPAEKRRKCCIATRIIADISIVKAEADSIVTIKQNPDTTL